ncbi:hypothetical protein FRC11_006282 [Ceratobasidium sp. 423]|nr:hypothetical protein FRC11_006282 [Ceratobasidium sp. 423]
MVGPYKCVITPSDNSPVPRRTHRIGYRNRVIVISDSESDSDLPSPSLLLQNRKIVGATSNLGTLAATDEIIEISSDSEIEATPTKPRGGERSSGAHDPPAALAAGSASTSVSALTSVFHSSLSLGASGNQHQTNSAARTQPGTTGTLSQPTESSSTDSERVDETKLFDQDAYHPGILRFDPGPRKPALITPCSGTTISTPGTSDYSQDLFGEGGTRIGNPSKGYSDDSSEDEREIKDPVGSPIPRNTTGNSKANSSGSGYRSRVRADINEGAAPETPRPRPKPKVRSVALTSALGLAALSPKPTPRNRAKVLQAAASALFAELNDSVFDGKLPKDCPIEWSKKLNTTAGRAHWKRYGRHSKSIDPEKQDYLKTHMKEFKTANPGMQHGEAMKRLGEMFRAEKEAMVDEELDQVMAGMTRLGIKSLVK